MPDELVQFNAAKPSGLAIYCSDGRFREATAKFVNTFDGNIDVIGIPGGAGALIASRASIIAVSAHLQDMATLLKFHPITRVLLIAHEDCAFYKTVLEKPADQLYEFQLTDMQTVKKHLIDLNPNIEVEMFYAFIDATGKIDFTRITT